MNPLDEKRLLAMMLRGIGTPDEELEEELKQHGLIKQEVNEQHQIVETATPMQQEPISDSLVNRAAAAISAKQKALGMPELPKKLHDSEIEGIRKQLQDVMARMGTMSWGGGGTGIVRVWDADDVNKLTLSSNNIMVKYQSGQFVGTTEVIASNVIISNTEGTGIKVNVDEPNYPWHDIIGQINPKFSGAGAPLRKLYKDTNIYDYSFAVNDAVDFVFHLPHDYVPGSNLYLHVHWSHQADSSISGNAEFTFSHSYSKGHNQEEFSTERTMVLLVPTPDLATVPQYRHRVDEGQIAAPTANSQCMPTANIEPDGVIIGQLKLTEEPVLGGTGSPSLFIHTVDVHYQSTNMGTQSRSPDFWSSPTNP